jgi:hypothetical protein
MRWFWQSYTRDEAINKIMSAIPDADRGVVYQLSTTFDPDYPEYEGKRRYGAGHIHKWAAMVRKHYE